MATFYHEYNKRAFLSAPQYTRSRHRFRGPRESQKINLEIDQTAYSLRKLYESFDHFKADFVDSANLLLDGGPSGVNHENDSPAMIVGHETLAGRIEQLKKRIQALEE